ncbi:hypothetical protein [Amycolatopsis sp. PS_44_ISF1]|uniref:hypothetical protein n=1 Tax=Amycolatopsis sp. PS_44_ISF1 TaxID=2974917 RepID=UPI0028DDC5BE|nr:hypothetical protein [Amycolatopsis sp. PS_44_ISF1]MDT8912603.1 hypothetical protein [Amycolatopsis sp. PS_44_ISF1]
MTFDGPVLPASAAARGWIEPALALYTGGMGARSVAFHHEVPARLGYAGDHAAPAR